MSEPNYDRLGYALAMQVLQSSLYRHLDERERDECDELIARGQGRSQHSKSGTEAVARWMISHGYTTGHGDDLDDLLAELVRQVMEPHKPVPSVSMDGEPFGDPHPLDACKGTSEEC